MQRKPADKPARGPVQTGNKTRRSQEQRREETQSRVLDATIDLLCHEGYSKLTIASVAQAAGVSQGGILNHYPTKRELISAAARHALVEVLEGAHRAIAAIPPQSEPLDAFLAYLDDLNRQPRYLASVELANAARSDEALASDYGAMIRGTPREWVDAWTGFFSRSGYTAEDARSLVVMTNYVLTGTIVYSFAAHSADTRAMVKAEWRQMAHRLFQRSPAATSA